MNIFERRWAALTRRGVTTATGKATQTTVGAKPAMAAHSNDAATSEKSGQDEKATRKQAEPCLRGAANDLSAKSTPHQPMTKPAIWKPAGEEHDPRAVEP